jgi:hypothetical protein
MHSETEAPGNKVRRNQNGAHMWEGFGWRSIDCFLRPQAHLVELASPGASDAFLPLLSAYRAHGVKGHFTSIEKGHFYFLEHVGSAHLGVDFLIDRCVAPDDVLSRLERALSAGEPVIVPGLPKRATTALEPTSLLEEDGHYYLVIRNEANHFVVLDSAEVAPYERSEQYREIRLPRSELEALVRAFSDTSRLRALSPLRDPGLWTLRVVARSGSLRSNPPRLRVLAAIRVALTAISPGNVEPFDRRHLMRLRMIDRSCTRTQKERSLKVYLKEANLCDLYLLMLTLALPDNATFADTVHAYIERNRRRRERLMVEWLTRSDQVDWIEAEQAFEFDRRAIVRHVHAAIR